MYLLYPSIGPAPSAASRLFGSERAEKMVADWRAWRSRYGAAWDAGEDVPPPPHREEFK